MVLVIFVLLKFGPPSLAFVASLLTKSDETEDSADKTAGFIAPPVLFPTYSATNSATVTIAGLTVGEDRTIRLYLNNREIDETKAKDDGSFSFKNVSMKKGQNTFKARAYSKDDKKSDFSNQVSVLYASEPPKLSVDSPSKDQSFKKDDKIITVSGKTDPGVRVTVNDLRAIVNEDGSFFYSLSLKDGDNTIKTVATDDAGNKTEDERKVTYSP